MAEQTVSYCSLTTLATSVVLQKQRFLGVIWIIQLFKVKQLYLILSTFYGVFSSCHEEFQMPWCEKVVLYTESLKSFMLSETGF